MSSAPVCKVVRSKLSFSTLKDEFDRWLMMTQMHEVHMGIAHECDSLDQPSEVSIDCGIMPGANRAAATVDDRAGGGSGFLTAIVSNNEDLTRREF